MWKPCTRSCRSSTDSQVSRGSSWKTRSHTASSTSTRIFRPIPRFDPTDRPGFVDVFTHEADPPGETSAGRRPSAGAGADPARGQRRRHLGVQAKNTRSAKQLLKKRAEKEARHATHTNHKVAKTVVAVAQRTGRGIALEELQGIRGRVTVPRGRRARLSCWRPSTSSARSSSTRPAVSGCRSPRWIRPTPPECARSPGTGTPRGTTIPPGTPSAVVGAASLGPPMSSPGSTCASARARRGYSSTGPIRFRCSRGRWM